MKPGPKPVPVDGLKLAMLGWAVYLFALRDGRSGWLRRMQHFGPWRTKTTFHPLLREDEIGYPEKTSRAGLLVPLTMHYSERTLSEALPVPPTKQALKAANELLRGKKGWCLEPPVFARPRIWDRLKNARSVSDVRQVARGLHQSYREPPVSAYKIFHSHAEDLLRAKQLPHYPRSNRPRSDDKRIHFFAKVLAGLDCGIAPATATKRLAHFNLLPKKK